MIDKINPIYNVSMPVKSSAKTKDTTNVSNPIATNVNFRGAEIAANYNIAAIKKDDNLMIYDKNKNLKQVIDYSKENENTRVSYFDNKPVSTEKRTYDRTSELRTDINPFEDKDLQPAEYYEIGDTTNVQGQKFYYSNGQLDKIITPDGKTYKYNLDGEFEYLKDGNKTIYGQTYEKIVEDLGNGIERATHYDDKHQITMVDYSKGDTYKNLFLEMENEVTYQQCDDGYSVLQIDYDETKKPKSQLVWYHDANDAG